MKHTKNTMQICQLATTGTLPCVENVRACGRHSWSVPRPPIMITSKGISNKAVPIEAHIQNRKRKRTIPAMEIEIATSMQKQVQCNVLWRRLWYRVSFYKDVSALRLKLPTIMKSGQNWKMKSQLGKAFGKAHDVLHIDLGDRLLLLRKVSPSLCICPTTFSNQSFENTKAR